MHPESGDAARVDTPSDARHPSPRPMPPHAEPRRKYSFSFLTGGMYLHECLVSAGLLLDEPDAAKVAERIRNENLFQLRKESSVKRVIPAVRERIESMSHDDLAYFTSAPVSEQKLLLFVSICRKFRFIADFVEEVLRPKAAIFDWEIRPSDWSEFLVRKRPAHPEIDELSDLSLGKIRQVVFKMLFESGLIDSTEAKHITPPIPSGELLRRIAATDPAHLRWILLSDADIRSIAA